MSAGNEAAMSSRVFFNNGLDVNVRAFTEAAAAESENSIDEDLGPPGRMHHVVNVAPQRGVCRRLLLRKFTVSQDRAQDIVESWAIPRQGTIAPSSATAAVVPPIVPCPTAPASGW